jgi:IclR family transcriptional regulator, acetate operon repressor
MNGIAIERAGGVQSIERAFTLLEVLAARDGALGVTDLAGESGLSLGTTHRLLKTLVGMGYVRQDQSRGYALGPGFIRLGERATHGLASWSRHLLEKVVSALDESVNLASLDNDQVIYVAHVPSSQSMRTFTEVGSRVAAHSTGVGKAMLARMPKDQVRALLDRTGMPASTPRTLTDPDALLRELEVIAARGYALDEGEQEDGVRCVAVPVLGAAPSLAVSISGPSARVTDELVQQAVPLLIEIADTIARQTSRNQER